MTLVQVKLVNRYDRQPQHHPSKDAVHTEGNTLVCRRCGQRHQMDIQQSINVLTSAVSAYLATHQQCRWKNGH